MRHDCNTQSQKNKKTRISWHRNVRYPSPDWSFSEANQTVTWSSTRHVIAAQPMAERVNETDQQKRNKQTNTHKTKRPSHVTRGQVTWLKSALLIGRTFGTGIHAIFRRHFVFFFTRSMTEDGTGPTAGGDPAGSTAATPPVWVRTTRWRRRAAGVPWRRTRRRRVWPGSVAAREEWPSVRCPSGR